MESISAAMDRQNTLIAAYVRDVPQQRQGQSPILALALLRLMKCERRWEREISFRDDENLSLVRSHLLADDGGT